MLRRLEVPLVLSIAGVITAEIGGSLLPISTGTVRGIVAFVGSFGLVLLFIGLWLIIFNLSPMGRKD